MKVFSSALFMAGLFLVLPLFYACNGNSGNHHNGKDTLAVDTPKVVIPKEEPSPVDAAALELTELARYMSAMPALDTVKGGSLDSLRRQKAWAEHEKFFVDVWEKVETDQLANLRPFAAKHFAAEQKVKDVFYPFSGPDFLYANAFFPEAEQYVMCGLEPVGKVPSIGKLTEKQLANSLKGIQTSLYAILKWSFFRTNDMRNDFVRTEFEGIVPVIMVFMARTGHTLLKVEQVEIDTAGNIQVLPNDVNEKEIKGVHGARIAFIAPGQKKARFVYYFSCDVSNNNWPNVAQFGTFVSKMDHPVTYLKSASYLMHKEYFSKIRDLILAESPAILQDDSGINLKYIDPEKWNMQFFGKYVGPIGLFSNWYQTSLEKYYKSETVIPLDFGIGYQFKAGNSNLMIFRKK
ncbi:MAG: hypothetical protein H6581_02060 [Bacteroidia bacterium]|nr:hypothetical protein [Bacteroidia bacterium]